ncbi:hypothetical protein MHC_04825 [Mycoplasma haemocanis str. Illinois]|uniref:Uncharacterized protein n=1 Tax=Mycoplasma haemocanis (strain Illinois) TaxID=1111676 RepID=H6N849_MYCHN|nr:hypothetical protein [Mycoplasma haemocanis]AEW45821.1 hypothetical protein MHC_04825 [Mycoplasma haemocanis str. Illinois]
MGIISNLLLSKKVIIPTSSMGVLAGSSYWYLTRVKSPSNVGDMLTSAGFKTLLSDASKMDWNKILTAYKQASKDEQISGVEYNGVSQNQSDEDLKRKIENGCKIILSSGDMNKQNLELGRRWCVVTTNVRDIVEQNGYKFLDYDGHKDDRKWESKLETLKKRRGKDTQASKPLDVVNMKSSCKELAEAPTYHKSFNKSVEIAKDYCSEKQ